MKEEIRIIKTDDGEKITKGYFLTLEEIQEIVSAFHGLSRSKVNIKQWINKHLNK